MAYFIFLKYLGSLEEFRKNPHVQISKGLVNSKIQFLIQKSFFFTFSPATLTGQLGLRPNRPRWPLSSRRPMPTLPAQAARPMRAIGVFAKIRFLL
jgi:hypothetical protein